MASCCSICLSVCLFVPATLVLEKGKWFGELQPAIVDSSTQGLLRYGTSCWLLAWSVSAISFLCLPASPAVLLATLLAWQDALNCCRNPGHLEMVSITYNQLSFHLPLSLPVRVHQCLLPPCPSQWIIASANVCLYVCLYSCPLNTDYMLPTIFSDPSRNLRG